MPAKVMSMGNEVKNHKKGRPRQKLSHLDGQASKKTVKADVILKLTAGVRVPKKIVKRDGSVVDFEAKKIVRAIRLCFDDIKREPATAVEELAESAINVIAVKY